jgi:hypothetical protein
MIHIEAMTRGQKQKLNLSRMCLKERDFHSQPSSIKKCHSIQKSLKSIALEEKLEEELMELFRMIDNE